MTHWTVPHSKRDTVLNAVFSSTKCVETIAMGKDGISYAMYSDCRAPDGDVHIGFVSVTPATSHCDCDMRKYSPPSLLCAHQLYVLVVELGLSLASIRSTSFATDFHDAWLAYGTAPPSMCARAPCNQSVLGVAYHRCPGCRAALHHACWTAHVTDPALGRALPACPACGSAWPLNKKSVSTRREGPARERLLAQHAETCRQRARDNVMDMDEEDII